MVNNRQILNQILQSTPFLSYFKSTLHYGEEKIPERPEHAQLWRGWYSIHVPELLKVSGAPSTSKVGAKEDAAMRMAAEVRAYRDVRTLNQSDGTLLNVGQRNFICSLLSFSRAAGLPSNSEAHFTE
jgi:hypothetical protein